MKLRNTAIALGVGAATASGLSLLKVNKEVVVGSTAVVVVGAFLISDKKFSEKSTYKTADESDKEELQEFFWLLGKDQKDSGKIEEALASFNKALEINPKNIYALNSRGHCFHELKNYGQAIEDYTNALEIDPNDSLVLRNRANSRCELDDYENAIFDLNKVIKLESIKGTDISPYLIQRAISKVYLNELEDAIEDFTQVLKKNSEDYETFYLRGLALADAGNNDEAIADFTKAIALNSDYEQAFFNRALSKDSISDYEGSIDDLNKTIALNPKNAEAFNIRGLTKYRDTDDWDGAVEDFKKAIEIDPSFARAFYNLGDIVYDIGVERDSNEKEKMEEAIEYFTKALELDPTIEEAYRFREWSLRRIGRHQEAVDDCKKLIDIDSENGEAYQELGLNQKELKEFDSAIKNLTKSIELLENEEYSEIASSYLLRGEAKKGLGDLKGACEDWKKAAELGNEEAAKLLEEHCE